MQAKGGNDQIGIVQATQDMRYAAAKFPEMRCRPIAAQFMKDERGDIVAMFELTLQEGHLQVAEERHYRLVPHDRIDRDAIRNYRM